MSIKKLENNFWVLWLILFLFFSVYEFISHGFELRDNLIFWPGAYFLSLTILTFPAIKLLESTKSVNKIIASSLLFGIVQLLLEVLLMLLLERMFILEEHFTIEGSFVFLKQNWYEAFQGVLWFFLIVILYKYVQAIHKSSLKDAEIIKTRKLLSDSKVTSMGARLNPHFIFNAMNNISMLIRKGENKKAVNMSAALSGLLRRALKNDNNHLVPLEKELHFLNEYIQLELMRYGDSVQVEVKKEDQVKNPAVPQMMLQPILENAFKYGDLEEAGRILLSIKKDNNRLQFIISNPGEFENTWQVTDKGGIGLNHTVFRLKEIYNDSYSFNINETKEGVSIVLSIPYEES